VLAKQATFVKPASVHERIRQLQDIDQDVCWWWSCGQCDAIHQVQEACHGP
jgi:hypothetical protein